MAVLPAISHADDRSAKLAKSAQMLRQVQAAHALAEERLNTFSGDPAKEACLRDTLISFSALLRVTQNADAELQQAANSHSPDAAARFDDAYARVAFSAGEVDKLRLALANCVQDQAAAEVSGAAQQSINDDMRSDDPAFEDENMVFVPVELERLPALSGSE